MFSFSNFTFGFHDFTLNELKIIQYDFGTGARKKIKDKRECFCRGTIGLIVALWKFDVLKTSIFALEASLLGQIFVLRTSNFRRATISR